MKIDKEKWKHLAQLNEEVQTAAENAMILCDIFDISGEQLLEVKDNLDTLVQKVSEWKEILHLNDDIV